MNKQQIIELLKTNDKAVARALVALNARQTDSEQATEETRVRNGQGFRPCHARMGTSMANFYQHRGYLTAKQIAYWRKHPNLQGWMEQLAEKKGLEYGSFNGIELELTWEDLDALERAVTHNQLPETTGFFFGNPSDEHYRESDLRFIQEARAELFLGLKVFYNSSW